MDASQLPHISPREPHAAPTLRNSRVVVLGAQHRISDTLALLLAFLGYDPVAIYEAETAIERVRAFRPSMVVVDLDMRTAACFRVVRALTRDRRKPLMVGLIDEEELLSHGTRLQTSFDVALAMSNDVEQLSQTLHMLASGATACTGLLLRTASVLKRPASANEAHRRPRRAARKAAARH